MKYECVYKAILSNVDETVIENLDIGNGYSIIKEKLFRLCDDFDYTDFGIRRVYETSTINNKLDVAVLYKKMVYEIEDKDKFDTKSVEFVNREIAYIDEKMRLIRLFSNNAFNIKNLAYIEDNGLYKTHGRVPFPDRIYNPVKLHLKNKAEIKRINKFVNEYDIKFNKSTFDKDKLIKACLLYDSTYTSNYPIICFMCGVIALESLLGDDNSKTDISYKLARNCGILLAKNEDEYIQVKKDIKRIYNLRSKFVHTGIVDKVSNEDVMLIRDYLRETIFRIVELNMNKEDLLKQLDVSGFKINNSL